MHVWRKIETLIYQLLNFKKSTIFQLRKSQYGSDAWTLSPSGGSDRPEGWGAARTPPTIVKSESFSGVGGGRADSSDSSTRSESVTVLRGQEESGDVTLVQGDETGGEETEEVPHLAFRLGPEAGSVTATGWY